MGDENHQGIEKVLAEDSSVAADVDSESLNVDEGDDPSINSVLSEQDREAEQFAIAFLKKVIRLRGVRIDRAQFLRAELHKRGVGAAAIDRAVRENPAVAGISPTMLDDIARSVIEFETGKSTALSFAAGLPGGFAMIGTVPADITQFYVHAFRVMQKIAYVYGWHSFLDDIDDIDDESLGMLAAFLGVMMGVGGASVSVSVFATQVARPAVQKKITGVALTKTAWYIPMKQTLRVVGVQVTKQSFAKTVSKVVPVVGGVVSGGLTFVTLRVQSKRLMEHLRELPPPNVDAEVYLAAVKRADEMAQTNAKSIGGAIVGAAGAVGANVAGLFKSKKKEQSSEEGSRNEDSDGEDA
ncbi:hypothetical protein [Kribbella caucasensis]|uniref:hypothetical protein n=1 Tax=Kribbella caucasensis TaxID=2512215 RepID=UPI00192D5E90|nr:hypothetical protein [Kribbella sp. VKM Ac-2527]